MKYAVAMASGAMIVYIPSLIKTGSGTQKVLGGIDIHTYIERESEVLSEAYFHLFQNKESSLKM
jgi:hypothetical protein